MVKHAGNEVENTGGFLNQWRSLRLGRMKRVADLDGEAVADRGRSWLIFRAPNTRSILQFTYPGECRQWTRLADDLVLTEHVRTLRQ